MSSKNAKRILVAPLDWGLGHTSRCLPIIRHLQAKGHDVVVAGNDWQRAFVNRSCPGVETIPLEGYNISYSRSVHGFMFSMFRQLPKILAAMRYENDWLMEQVAKYRYDGIISDNRYGLFHKKVPSVIMTHQLSVRTGLGKVADDMLRRLHYKYLQRFSKCWVVDSRDKNNLGGKLSHPKYIPMNAEYIGLLSQFEDNASVKTGDDLLVLLSGPEPQRTILSELLWKQVVAHKGKVIFVEGSNDVNTPTLAPAHISWHKRLAAHELQPLIQDAGMVICRSGYSTLMDLARLGKKAIVVPTPGQTEQMYLAKYLHRKGAFFGAAQKNLELATALQQAARFPFKQLSLQNSFSTHQSVLDNWLETL